MQAKYLLLLRGVLGEVLLLHVLYAPEGRAWSRGWLWTLLASYALAAAAVHWAATRLKLRQKWLPATFLIDVAVTSAALVGTADVGSDLYIAYFLVILASCLQENLGYSFIVGVVSCIVYGALTYPGPDWLEQPFYLLHGALLLLTAFFGAYVTSAARRADTAVEERYEQKVAWMQRLSWVGQAISAVLHEVRTPLNTVLLSTEYASRRLEEGKKDEVAEQLSIINKQTARAIGIVSNYLEFAQPSELTLVPLSLQQPLRAAVDGVRVLCKDKEISLDAELGTSIPISGSQRHLEQVFANILGNAIDAMPLGGRLEIRVSRADPVARVTVRDTGVGIEPEMSARLFKPFQTSKGDYEGHGLGLSIARWIVQKHAGDLSISSAGKGRGAEVVVSLPVSPVGKNRS